ncbi:MAG: hypothetical protein JEZ14_17575 [Marinilabiliaceae bacterium]|nr:hypothetical protein [Marinilabiliaceae bacterium]
MKKIYKTRLFIITSLLLSIGMIYGQDVQSHSEKHQQSEWYLLLKSTTPNYHSITDAYENYFKEHEYVKTDAVREYIRWTRAVSGNYDANGNLLTVKSDQRDLKIIKKEKALLKSTTNSGSWQQIGPFTFDLEARYRTNTQGVVRSIQQFPDDPSKVLMGCIPWWKSGFFNRGQPYG